MTLLKVKQENVEAAMKLADEKTKPILEALFGIKKQGTIYERVKCYEDACRELKKNPEDFSGLPIDEIAYRKLKTISEALWEGEFPEPDGTGDKYFYFPWFYLYTQDEVDNMTEEEKEEKALLYGALFSGTADLGTPAGFGYTITHNRSSLAAAYTGFRLCQMTDDKARYFGRQFIQIWADYLLIKK
ncbi:MAG: hypothetical protein AB2L20_11725 [Mangrovibacterium sp.]